MRGDGNLTLTVSVVMVTHYYLCPCCVTWADPEGDPLKNHKNLGILCNTGLDPLKNHKATRSEFNVGPSTAHQRNTIDVSLAGH